MAVEVEINAKNMVLADPLKNRFIKKASKLNHYLNEIEYIKIDLEFIKTARSAMDRNVAQITVRGHKTLLRVEERNEEINTAFDSAVEKMQRQLERYKGKHFHGRGDGKSTADVTPVEVEAVEEPVQEITRHKTFDLIPMSEGEALEQMKLLGHDNFFIFFNVQTDTINVLYHRRDGTFGLIEPKVR